MQRLRAYIDQVMAAAVGRPLLTLVIMAALLVLVAWSWEFVASVVRALFVAE